MESRNPELLDKGFTNTVHRKASGSISVVSFYGMTRLWNEEL
jgi:hypothetical protein